MATDPEPLPAAPLVHRLASLGYEALLVVAILFAAGLVYSTVETVAGFAHFRPLLQAYLLIVGGAYFCWHWVRGQTLPMKTWRIHVVMRSGEPVDFRHALLRYVAAVLGLAAGGLTFLWAFADRDGQFLHDRVAGTRLVRTAPSR